MSNTEKTRWQSVKTALLEGLDERWTEILDVLLEKSRKDMVIGQATHDDHAAAIRHSEVFNKMILPVLRRTVPNTLTNQLIAVNMPSVDVDTGATKNMLSMRYHPNDFEVMREDNDFDVEAEILAAIAQEVSIEIDQSVLKVLRELVSPVYTIELKESGSIIHSITKIASDIRNRVDNDSGDCWVVVSPYAFTRIMMDDTGSFNRGPDGGTAPGVHISCVGTIRGPIKVYVDVYADIDSPLLIGHRGDDDDDDYAGIRYDPYILSTYGDTAVPITDGIPLFENGRIRLPDNAENYLGLINIDM